MKWDLLIHKEKRIFFSLILLSFQRSIPEERPGHHSVLLGPSWGRKALFHSCPHGECLGSPEPAHRGQPVGACAENMWPHKHTSKLREM